MLRPMTSDPAAFFRAMLGEWEKHANSFGGDMLKSGEWSRAMNGAQSAGLQAQEAFRQFTERALAAANLPSRTEFEALSARIAGIEAALFRIERLLKGEAPAAPARPKPTRGRRPLAESGA